MTTRHADEKEPPHSGAVNLWRPVLGGITRWPPCKKVAGLDGQGHW